MPLKSHTLQSAVIDGLILVDAADILRYGYWSVHLFTRTAGYIVVRVWNPEIVPLKRYVLSRLLLDIHDERQVDHENHISTDNRRSNLRVATPSEQARNRRKSIKNTSGYKGVSWHKSRQLYMVTIKSKHGPIFLGRVADPEVGARMYDEAAKKYFGEFACLNFPEA